MEKMDFDWLEIAADLAHNLDPDAKVIEEMGARPCLGCSLRKLNVKRRLQDLRLPTAALRQTKIASIGKGRAQILKERSLRVKQVGAKSQGSSGISTPSSVGRMSPSHEVHDILNGPNPLEQCKKLLQKLISYSSDVDVMQSVQPWLEGSITTEAFAESVQMKAYIPLLKEQLPSLQRLIQCGELMIEGLQLNPALRNGELPRSPPVSDLINDSPSPVSVPEDHVPSASAASNMKTQTEMQMPLIRDAYRPTNKAVPDIDEFMNHRLGFGTVEDIDKETSDHALNGPVINYDSEDDNVDDGREYFRDYVPGYLLKRTYDYDKSGAKGGFSFGDGDDDDDFPPEFFGPPARVQKRPEVHNLEEFPSLGGVERIEAPPVKVEAPVRKMDSITNIASSLFPTQQPPHQESDARHQLFQEELEDAEMNFGTSNDSHVLCIENLPLDCDKEALCSVLEMYGDVMDCRMGKTEFGLKALVRMPSEEIVDWVVECLTGESPLMAAEGQRLTCYKM